MIAASDAFQPVIEEHYADSEDEKTALTSRAPKGYLKDRSKQTFYSLPTGSYVEVGDESTVLGSGKKWKKWYKQWWFYGMPRFSSTGIVRCFFNWIFFVVLVGVVVFLAGIAVGVWYAVRSGHNRSGATGTVNSTATASKLIHYLGVLSVVLTLDIDNHMIEDFAMQNGSDGSGGGRNSSRIHDDGSSSSFDGKSISVFYF